MQRHRIGEPSNMARDDGDRSEFSHRARIAENHTIEQAPFDIREGHPYKRLPSRRAQRERRLFFLSSLRLHQWDQFARQMKKVFPDRQIVDLPLTHEIFHTFYDIDEILQPPNDGNGERYTLSRERYVEAEGEFADAVLGDFNGENRFIVAVEGKGPRDPLDRPFAGRRMAAGGERIW